MSKIKISDYIDFDGEIRLIGTQEKKSAAQRRAEDEATAEAIRQWKEAEKRKAKSKKAS